MGAPYRSTSRVETRKARLSRSAPPAQTFACPLRAADEDTCGASSSASEAHGRNVSASCVASLARSPTNSRGKPPSTRAAIPRRHTLAGTASLMSQRRRLRFPVVSRPSRGRMSVRLASWGRRTMVSRCMPPSTPRRDWSCACFPRSADTGSSIHREPGARARAASNPRRSRRP